MGSAFEFKGKKEILREPCDRLPENIYFIRTILRAETREPDSRV